MEKLGQLRRSDEWDLIVVDTPPSRSALDFLDAPKRLGRFLDGRLVRFLGTPARGGAFRLLGAGFGLVTGVITKILGTHAFVVPYANADEANHAPNENLKLACFLNGIRTGAALLSHIGRLPARSPPARCARAGPPGPRCRSRTRATPRPARTPGPCR